MRKRDHLLIQQAASAIPSGIVVCFASTEVPGCSTVYHVTDTPFGARAPRNAHACGPSRYLRDGPAPGTAPRTCREHVRGGYPRSARTNCAL